MELFIGALVVAVIAYFVFFKKKAEVVATPVVEVAPAPVVAEVEKEVKKPSVKKATTRTTKPVAKKPTTKTKKVSN